MSKHVADLLILDREEDIIAVVEVKNWSNLVRQQAEEILPELLDYRSLAEIPALYLLLIVKDAGFVWKNAGQPDQQFAEFSMQPVFDHYLLEIEDRKTYTEQQLQLLVLQWLNNLTWNEQGVSQEPERTLNQLGFIDSIQGASIRLEVKLYDRVR